MGDSRFEIGLRAAAWLALAATLLALIGIAFYLQPPTAAAESRETRASAPATEPGDATEEAE